MGLARTGFIPVPPGTRPGFDHADVYRAGAGTGRLYVAHTGADRVDVIDCAAGSYLRSLPGHPGIASVLINAGQDLLFTSDRDAAQVSVYRCSDEQPLARVQGRRAPQRAGLYNPVRRRLLSFNLGEPLGENCTASVIDIDAGQVTAAIELPGRPRWAAYDPASGQIYACIRQPAQILAIDPRPPACLPGDRCPG